MKFGLMFVNSGPFANPKLFEVLVRTADEVGIESLWTVEHVVVPVGYESQYPYSPTGRMPGNSEKIPIPDPIVPLAYAAAITKQIKLGTGILILPQRHPVYVAKEMATLDVLSGGRALLGVGIGWLEEEFEVVGVPFRERAARTEESVRALRSLWAPEPSRFEGRFYRWGPVESYPKPVQPRGVPIVVGGHVEGAARRAARVGDGFFPARGELDLLAKLFAAMRDECGKVGRKPEEIELTTGMTGNDRDSVRRYEDLGVSRLIVSPPGFDPDGLRRGLEDFANRLIR
ncbi:MAG TPA: LLM class F420-dependent oxidoreductase [Myxococcota bacterium]|jgi:probable F420-dependent oxidoreductase|nr:LLM class F420-dependent oxidoreductase [Myxococcota bacterium]